MSPARHQYALPAGYRLHWYEIDSILGQGGFGITYLAQDENLDQQVAIKEFLPTDLATRTQDSAVHPLTDGHTDTYGWGLNRFLTEARTLAKFRHPNIVRVLSVFEANNTAYMVMEYERGESLESALRGHRIAGEETLKGMLLALLNGLALVHDAGFIHRDIKPSNVYLREDGVPVLLDFGSARLALGVETRTLTSLVSPGYAPFEQYNATRESDKQGPWTDIYALAATLYRAITGQGPIDAAARANLLLDENRDPFTPCSEIAEGKYSAPFLHAIDRALAFRPGDRPQSVQAWRVLLEADHVDPDAATALAQEDETVVRDAVDFLVDPGDTRRDTQAPSGPATRTIPLTQPAVEAQATAAPVHRARRWFVATAVVAALGVAAVAWLVGTKRSIEDVTPVVSAPRESTLAPSGPAEKVASVPAPSEPSAGGPVPSAEAVAAPAERAPTESLAPAASTSAATPSAPQASTAPSTPAPPAPATAATGSSPPDTAAQTPSALTAAAKGTAVSAPAPPSSPPPPAVTETAPPPPPVTSPAAKSMAEKTVEPPAPVKKPVKPTTVAKAATPPPPAPEKATKNTVTESKRKPATRQEKIEVLLAQGDADLRAGRLTSPKKRNALYRYLTVVAMEPGNEAARRGVEKVLEKHLAAARAAASAGKIDTARKHLNESKFVLDAMKLRKWPPDTLSFFDGEYRELNQLLAKGG